MEEIKGYERNDGTYGIRNHVVVMATVECVNTVAANIASATGAIPILTASGCMDNRAKLDRTRLCLLKAASNPNTAAVLVVGLGCEHISAVELYQDILAKRPDSKLLMVQQEGGSLKAIAKGIEIVKTLKVQAADMQKKPISLKEIVIGITCGGSDWTSTLAGNPAIGYVVDKLESQGGSILYGRIEGLPGSEHALAKRAVSPEVGREIIAMVDRLKHEFFIENGCHIEEMNPTPGNKEGGITTLIEKSIGNVKKSGTCPIQGIIRFGWEIPRKGLWFIDAKIPGPDSYGVTTYAIHGAHLDLFSSGLGNPIGNAIIPVIKLTGNPDTYASQMDNFDFNAGTILEGSSISETGEALYKLFINVINGKQTLTEALGYYEFSIPY